MPLQKTRYPAFARALLLLLLLCRTLSAFGVTPAGTSIVNVGQVDYTDPGGALFTIRSNAVETIVSSLSTLVISKTAPEQVMPGSDMTYSIVYANTGNTIANNVVITDGLSPNVGFLSATQNGRFENDIVTWQLGNLAPGDSGIIRMTVRVNPVLSQGAILENVAIIRDAANFPVQSNSVATRVSGAPKLVVEKVASPEVLTPGEEVTYTITYANEGDGAAPGVTLIDEIPAGLRFISASGDAIENNGIVTWQIGDIQPNTSDSIQLTLKADVALADGTVIPNISRLRNANGVTTSGEVLITIRRRTAPIWEITKVADKMASQPGEALIYTISFTNQSDPDATGVSVQDALPELLRYVEGSADRNGVFDEASRTVNWQIPVVAAGESQSVTFSAVVVANIPGAVTPILNVATVGPIDTPTPTISAPSEVIVRGTAIPGTITLVPNPETIVGDGKHSSILTASVFDINGNPMPDGTSVTLTTTKGTFTNGAQEILLTTTDGTASTSLLANIVSNRPVEAFARAVAGTPVIGQAEAVVRIIFSPGAIAGVLTDNLTGQPLVGVLVTVTEESSTQTDRLVRSNRQIAAQDDVFVGTAITDENGAYFVPIPLPANYIVAITIRDNFDREITLTEVVNVTAVFGEIFEPNNAIHGNAVDLQTQTPLPNVQLRLLHPAGNPVIDSAGNPIFMLTAEDGSYQVQGLALGFYRIEVVESLPGYYSHGFLNVDANQEGHYVYNANLSIDPLGIVFDEATGEPIQWAVVSLFDLSSDEIVQLPPYLGQEQPNPELSNPQGFYDFFVPPGEYRLRVTATDYEDFVGEPIVVSGNVVNLDVPMRPIPQLSLTKAADKGMGVAGELITYTIAYKNEGANATEAVIVDIPENLTFVSASDGGTLNDDNTITWDLGRIAARSSGSVELKLRVDEGVVEGDVIENIALFETAQTEAIAASASVTARSPVLRLNKFTDAERVEPGAEVTYTLEYANAGSEPATGRIWKLGEGLKKPPIGRQQ